MDETQSGFSTLSRGAAVAMETGKKSEVQGQLYKLSDFVLSAKTANVVTFYLFL